MIKILSLFLSFSLLIEQTVFAQSIDLSHYFANSGKVVIQNDKFRPPRLRYISYDSETNDFQILLDKGDFFNQKTEKTLELEKTSQELMKYFFIGLALPNEKFWVNLRPDSPDNILDPDLEKTDIGRIFLEADLQLKKDTSSWTSPQTPEGKAYWDKLYKKAGELFGSQNITIPTITRPWIVPGEIIIGESPEGAYIYKATLKVMLEEDYLRGMKDERRGTTINYSFKDSRLKELNEYSTQLIKETIIPKLTYEINTSKRYAPLRQVYYSLILAQWFKARFRSQRTEDRIQRTEKDNNYIDLIDSGNLANLASREPYDKQVYFRQYQKSFKDGEYNLQEPVYTPTGQNIRRYMSGGLQLNSPPITRIETGKSINIRPYLTSIGSPITDTFIKKQAEILFQSLLSLHEEIMKASPKDRNTILEGWSFRIKDAIADAAGLSPEEKETLGKAIHDATPSAHKREFTTLAKSRGKERIRLVMDIVKEAQKNIQNNNIFSNDEKNTIQKIFRKVHNLASSSIYTGENHRWGAITAERGWKEFSDISPEMGEKLEKSLAERIKNGRKPIILVAGVGRGRLPIDLLMKYGIDALDIYSLNLEDESMLFNPEKLQREIRIPKEEGRSAEDYINRLKKNPNDENPNKKSRYISHDLRNGLPDFPVKFDLIIIPNHVLRYIPDCLLKVVDPLVRNALAPKGELFAAINNVVVPAANTTDQGIRSILKKLRGWKVSPDYPDILREPEFENIKPDIFYLSYHFMLYANKAENPTHLEEVLYPKKPTYYSLNDENAPSLYFKKDSSSSAAAMRSDMPLIQPNTESNSEKGGIDFHALPIETRQIDELGSLAGSPLTINPNLDFEAEWGGIQAVFNAGIRPSARRMAEFAVSARASPLNSRRLEDVRGLITDLLRRDEEEERSSPAEPELKGLLSYSY